MLSQEQARWLAINAQQLGRPRPNITITERHLRSTIDALGVLQLDAINVVARTQFLVLFSRLGAYDITRLHDLTGPGGELFEYWAHAASLVPMHEHPLFRWRMEESGPWGVSSVHAARRKEFRTTYRTYIDAILKEVRAHGPLTARQLSDPRRRIGEWWERRSLGRVALEYLFAEGAVAGWRAPNFERVYDIPERVIPADILRAPTPTRADAQRALILRAATALGIATQRDLASYYFIKGYDVKPRVNELVMSGELDEVRVDGWREPAYIVSGTRAVAPKRATATLLSPFDSLIWDRPRTLRVFGFDYRIEVYVPAPKRTYGYYVLPVLFGDALVGRLDCKADRKTSTLRVHAAHAEPNIDTTAVAVATGAELDALREWLGLDDTVIANKGSFARPLRRTH